MDGASLTDSGMAFQMTEEGMNRQNQGLTYIFIVYLVAKQTIYTNRTTPAYSRWAGSSRLLIYTDVDRMADTSTFRSFSV